MADRDSRPEMASDPSDIFAPSVHTPLSEVTVRAQARHAGDALRLPVTPKTMMVKANYMIGRLGDGVNLRDSWDEFDRWLADHDAKVGEAAKSE